MPVRVLCILLSMAMAFISWSVASVSASGLEKPEILQLRAFAQEIESIDALLTASALTFAFTQDDKWLKVYRENEVKLGALLEEALSRAHESDSALLKRMDEENERLVKMEVRAIELTQQGKGRQAAEILNSKQYQEEKLRLRQSIDTYFLSLEKHLQLEEKQDLEIPQSN